MRTYEECLNLKASGSGDHVPLRIYLDRKWEREFWSRKFGCNVHDLPARLLTLGDAQNGKPRIELNLQEKWELDYWCRKFDSNEKELREAVDYIGPVAEHVRDLVAGYRPPRPEVVLH